MSIDSVHTLSDSFGLSVGCAARAPSQPPTSRRGLTLHDAHPRATTCETGVGHRSADPAPSDLRLEGPREAGGRASRRPRAQPGVRPSEEARTRRTATTLSKAPVLADPIRLNSKLGIDMSFVKPLDHVPRAGVAGCDGGVLR